jgi:SAM-dependent methyltransferase
MNNERRIARAHSFDTVAELYDRARRCPEELIDDLFALAGMTPRGTSVLEVGCGTGQASVQLARRGCRIVCVEMGPNLARIARRNLASFPHASVVNLCFEDFKPTKRFDMVLAVTSWHWIDPKVRYARAAEALRPGGVLAFTTGAHAFPPGFDSFFAEIQATYEAIGEGQIKWPPPAPEEIGDSREEIERSGLFEDVRVARRVWEQGFTADEYVAMMGTASDHVLMEPEKREPLFSEMRRLISARPESRIRRHWLTILHVARRR